MINKITNSRRYWHFLLIICALITVGANKTISHNVTDIDVNDFNPYEIFEKRLEENGTEGVECIVKIVRWQNLIGEVDEATMTTDKANTLADVLDGNKGTAESICWVYEKVRFIGIITIIIIVILCLCVTFKCFCKCVFRF